VVSAQYESRPVYRSVDNVITGMSLTHSSRRSSKLVAYDESLPPPTLALQ
jgi:hypothetical protein